MAPGNQGRAQPLIRVLLAKVGLDGHDRGVKVARPHPVRAPPGAVARALKELQEAARDPDENLVPPTIEVVRARASMGEIVAALRDVYGTYQERPTS